ncbi:MAG: aminopeptidase P family protein [Proteobacteria bacterium]|nr:aminopeptidase P family protein [Burkholderiales bacterium]
MDPIFPRFSDAEYARREAVVRRELAASGLDAVIAVGDAGSRGANQANVAWLTNWWDPYPAYVVMKPSAAPVLLVSNQLYLHTAQRAARPIELRVQGLAPGDVLADCLADMGVTRGRVGVAAVRNVGRASMPSHHFDVLRARLPDVNFVDATDVFAKARLIKSPEEITWFERGAALTDQAMEAIERETRVGMPEYQLSAILHEAVLPAGGTLRLQFVGATPMRDPDLIFPWQYPSMRPLANGDVLLTEISAGWWGCSGQIQRPYAIGCAPTDEYLRLFDLAQRAYDGIIDVLRPGATDADVRAAAQFLDDEQCRTFDVLLHGWGLQIEDPRVDLPTAVIRRELKPVTFAEGMLLVVQPHVVSEDGRRAVQAGNLVVIDADGARPLQKHPMNFLTLG